VPCPIKGKALLLSAHCARVDPSSSILLPCPNRRARPGLLRRRSVVLAPSAASRTPRRTSRARRLYPSLFLVLACARRRRTPCARAAAVVRCCALRARQRCGRGAVARAPRRTPSGTRPRAPPLAAQPEPPVRPRPRGRRNKNEKNEKNMKKQRNNFN